MFDDPIRREDITRALTGAEDGPESDYHLNPEWHARLPANRVLKRAAVLCPIVQRRDGLAVILTRRSESLPTHPGQISFPGGRIERSDPSPMSAALREAEEEIGLSPRHVEIGGELPAYETSTGFTIAPFVGFIDPAFQALPEAGEVAEVFEAPLDFLMNPANHLRQSREWKGGRRHFYAMPWRGYHIWGATAGMLRALSNRLAALRRPEKASP